MKSAIEKSGSLANNQRGIALMFCLIALLILTAITTSLVLMSGTDTTVNANYRSEEVAFFAAKAGVYEALDRMQFSNANSIAAQLPTTTSGVLYLINAGSSLTVQPWTLTNTYVDDELCHEGIPVGTWPTTTQVLPPDVPCNSVPSTSGWYTTATSNYPWNGTAAALPYEWVRISWKHNSSVTYVSGTGSSAAAATYSVDSSKTASTPVCWNGGSEVLLSTPAGVAPSYINCEQYQTCAAANPVLTTPVFTITSLSVTTNGSRQMVQAEAALTPPSLTVPTCVGGDPYGFFAYGGTCASPGLTIAGTPLSMDITALTELTRRLIRRPLAASVQMAARLPKELLRTLGERFTSLTSGLQRLPSPEAARTIFTLPEARHTDPWCSHKY
ncbi:MAG TPA: pilus assembly PilX N-terminal domain-containing protein [Candidatus Acidoferrales bacterium]|nr:pilus assembly PilX N-terminal domain-containing protein [Candidatus Acidoferrales bacterium]